jgi:hypothetical protein
MESRYRTFNWRPLRRNFQCTVSAAYSAMYFSEVKYVKGCLKCCARTAYINVENLPVQTWYKGRIKLTIKAANVNF